MFSCSLNCNQYVPRKNTMWHFVSIISSNFVYQQMRSNNKKKLWKSIWYNNHIIIIYLNIILITCSIRSLTKGAILPSRIINWNKYCLSSFFWSWDSSIQSRMSASLNVPAVSNKTKSTLLQSTNTQYT